MNKRSGVICAGNWIVDLVHDIDHWPAESNLTRINAQTRGVGGGAANVIFALSRLRTGFPLWPMGAVGDDDYGAFILEECRALGLSTEQIKIKNGVATAHTHVMSVAGQSRTFFYQGGANDEMSASDFLAGTFANTPARLFYLGYLTLLGKLDAFNEEGKTDAKQVLQRAQAAGMICCVDLVSMPHPRFPAIVASAAPNIDYLIVNEIEAAQATQTKSSGTDAERLTKMAHELVAMGVRKAVVIHCKDRIVWANADGSTLVVDVPPVPSDQIASNLGAGDAFCAGLLFGIHESWAPAASIQLAIAAAKSSLRGHTATEAIPPLFTLMRTDE
ncbi:MAG: carbohydrate kinase family protein [Pseudomonadota bacterium]